MSGRTDAVEPLGIKICIHSVSCHCLDNNKQSANATPTKKIRGSTRPRLRGRTWLRKKRIGHCGKPRASSRQSRKHRKSAKGRLPRTGKSIAHLQDSKKTLEADRRPPPVARRTRSPNARRTFANRYFDFGAPLLQGRTSAAPRHSHPARKRDVIVGLNAGLVYKSMTTLSTNSSKMIWPLQERRERNRIHEQASDIDASSDRLLAD